MKKLLLLFVLFSCDLILGQSIISVTPDNGNKAQNLEVTITGQDVDFYASSPTINVSFIDQFSNILPATFFYADYNSANELYVGLSIPGYAVPGLYDVHVNDSGGAFDITLANGFTVNNAYTYSIQGNVRYDSNNNGCDASDVNRPNQKITFTNGSISGNLFANETGFYSYYDVQAGSNSFSPVLENPSYFTISPPSASVVLSTTTNLFVQDFCIAPNGIHYDLEVTVLPIGPARPGFDAFYKIIYKNKGTAAQSGAITLDFTDSVLDLVSSNPIVSSQGANTLNWNFSNLLPFESREITVVFNVNSPLETPAVNAGNLLTYNATITGATDETPSDNTSTLTQTVVNSFDPNDKTCIEGSLLPINEVGKYVHYVIRFENTGTANAENIVVEDIIDTSKFDINSLIPTGGSHSFVTRTTNVNKVKFIFENINLPFDDANNDGYVAFKIKTRSTLVIGNTFSNSANIYFDYNAPIVTDPYITTVFNPLLGLSEFDFNSIFTLSPVPAKNNLTITAKQDVTISSVNIYNTLGQLVQVITNPNKTIDVSGLTAGSYFIKIISDKGSASSKFIKE